MTSSDPSTSTGVIGRAHLPALSAPVRVGWRSWPLWTSAAALVILRIWYVFFLRIDQDEWQHLHSIWALGTGQRMYLDFFDNHMPLFHILCAPWMQWVGERIDIITVMRLAVIPFYFAALVLVAALTASLYRSRPLGLWAAVLTGMFPVFLFTGTEFRPDQCWTALWLGSLLVLLRREVTAARCFWSGLLLGAAVGISLKTVLMLASQEAGAVFTFLVARRRPDITLMLRWSAVMFAGLLIIPAAIVIRGALHGTLASAWYCVVEHNIRFAHNAPGMMHLRWLIFPVGLALVYFGARAIFRSSPDQATGLRRVFLFATGGMYFAILFSFWTVLNNETYLPGIAALAPALTSFLHRRSWRVPALTLAAAAELAVVLIARPLRWHPPTSERQVIGEVLALTRPGDMVMDESGENIYRQRPFYFLMETLTRQALKSGAIPDTIATDIAASGTCVVLKDSPYTEAARSFFDHSFLPFGHLLVAGQGVHSQPDDPRHTLRFDIAVPARYAFVARHGLMTGKLDGIPCDGRRFLSAGHHEMVPDDQSHATFVVWERAVDAGFTFDTPSENSHEAQGGAPLLK